METNPNQKEQSLYDKMSIRQFILRILQGILIGGGAIIPGVSGGVLCLAFGIYRPMMEFIAHPFKSLRKYIKLFIPIGIGGVIGFVGLADAVAMLFKTSPIIAFFLFVGLVAGTVPSLFKEAGKQGTSTKSWAGFVISIFFIYVVLSFFKTSINVNIEPNSWWYLFCGVLWGLSLVVPGLSSSSILIFMGLYEPMTEGVGALDFGVIIPLFAGILFIAAISARFVNYIYERYYSIVSHVIIGIVIGSTLLIIPENISGAKDIIYSILSFVVGFLIAWGMEKYGDCNNKVK